jgi:hypothetical protein
MRMGPQPASDLPATAAQEMQRAILVSGGVGLLREAIEGRAQVSALESKTVEGTALDRVAWKKGDLEMTLGLDPATHRIVTISYRGQTMQGPAETEVRLADYRKAANGLMVPMRATTFQNGQKAADLTITEWLFNTGIAPDTFSK